MQHHDYRLVIHMSPSFHDNHNNPYFWFVLLDGVSNCGCGWSVSPEQAFADGKMYMMQHHMM